MSDEHEQTQVEKIKHASALETYSTDKKNFFRIDTSWWLEEVLLTKTWRISIFLRNAMNKKKHFAKFFSLFEGKIKNISRSLSKSCIELLSFRFIRFLSRQKLIFGTKTVLLSTHELARLLTSGSFRKSNAFAICVHFIAPSKMISNNCRYQWRFFLEKQRRNSDKRFHTCLQHNFMIKSEKTTVNFLLQTESIIRTQEKTKILHNIFPT